MTQPDEFAAEVLRTLLRRIDKANRDGDQPYLVSHAWTDGPMMYLIFTAPPSDRTWGLFRDTRESLIDPAPWPDVDEAARYYYLLDFEENQPHAFPRRPGDPDTIRWLGDPHTDLPAHPSAVSDDHRHTSATPGPRRIRDLGEPRRYADPW